MRTLNKYFTGIVSVYMISLSCNALKHGGGSKNVMPGTWQKEPIEVDGDSKDWPSPYPNYDAKAMIAYATSNDRENLYITMQAGDEVTQMKILKQGMTVMIDTSGGKEAQLNINYPMPNDNDPLDLATEGGGYKGNSREPGGARKWEKMISKNADQATQLSLDGFSNCSGGYAISQTTPCGIKVKLRIDEYKELVWEAVVPFKAIYNRATITAADAGKPISVCFVVKGFKKPSPKNQDNNTGGMNNGMGTGIGMNSRMNGGARGGGRSNSIDNPLYETTKTWKHFSIAYMP